MTLRESQNYHRLLTSITLSVHTTTTTTITAATTTIIIIIIIIIIIRDINLAPYPAR